MSVLRFYIFGVIALLYFLGGAQTSFAEWPEQSCAFEHRIPVSVTASGGSISDEIRIDLTSSDFPASYMFTSSGNDLRIFESDDTTAVDYVVAGWDAINRSATLYIRPPAIASGTTETFYIYLGNDALGAGDNASIVFPDVGVRLRSRVSTANPTDTAGRIFCV